MTVDEELELIHRAQSGDQEAFVAVCQLHRALLWRIVSTVANRSDREDLAQEAVVRAYKSLASFRGASSFSAWLCRIAINAAHDYQKSGWRRRVIPMADDCQDLPETAETPHAVVERREMQRRVRQAVAGLRETQRIPIWLHYFEGFTLVEVARLEHISESTIRSRIQAGLKRLGPLLADYLPVMTPLSDQPQAKGCES